MEDKASIKSVISSWAIHEGTSDSSSRISRRSNTDMTNLTSVSKQSSSQAHLRTVPRPQRLGLALDRDDVRQLVGDLIPLDHQNASSQARMAFLDKMEGLPEALNMAKDSLVEQAVRMQADMRLFMDQFERRLSTQLDGHNQSLSGQLDGHTQSLSGQLDSHTQSLSGQLDDHKQSFQLVTKNIESRQQKDIVTEQKALEQPSRQHSSICSMGSSTPRLSSKDLSAKSDALQLRLRGLVDEVQGMLQEVGNDFNKEASEIQSAGAQTSIAFQKPFAEKVVSPVKVPSSAEYDPSPRYSDQEKADSTDNAIAVSQRSSHIRTPKKRLSKFTRIVISDKFNFAVGILIILNTFMLGVQTDIEVEDVMAHREPNHEWIRVVNLTFLSLFTVEIGFRILALRLDFFFGGYWIWNLLDGFLVCSAYLEEFSGGTGANFTFFRVIRVVRMSRTLRILRVFRFFRDLRLMVSSIILSFKSLTWALFLMLLLIYCCAIMFCQGVTTFMEDEVISENGGYGSTEIPETPGLDEFYGSVPKAMYTLIMAISGGKDWYDLIVPLTQVSRIYATLFVFYCLFVIFGMLNVLTGVFVDRAAELSRLDRDLVVESEKFKVESTRQALKSIFEEADEDNSGFISWPEFHTYCDREDVKAFFATMDIGFAETTELFHMFDHSASGRVNIDDFIVGCMRMMGHARNVDIMHMQEDVIEVQMKLNRLADTLNAFIRRIDASPYLVTTPDVTMC